MRKDWPTNGVVVEVEWIDSAATNGWQHEYDNEDAGLILCRSSGYLLSKDRRSVRIVQSQTGHGTHGELIAIPRTCVRSITRLVPKRVKD